MSNQQLVPSKQKLLIVTDAWAPQVNGVVTSVQNMSRVLTEEGLDVVIVHQGLFKRVYPLFFYPEISIAYFPGARMRALFKRERPDYVHISTEASLGQAARRYCIQNKIPFTTFYHTNFPLYLSHYFHTGTLFTGLAVRYMRSFHKKAKAVFVSSEGMKELLESQGHKNVVVSPNGADVELFVRNEERVPAELKSLPSPVFVYFGRVAREKNVEEFLSLELPGTKLVIGGGPHLEELQREYVGRAVFVGYKRGQELVDWLSGCHVSVFPSRTDTFGLVVVEALACGVPVAAHDVTGPKDIITNGIDGYLDEDLREAAQRCLQLSTEACREKALTYSWNAVGKRFLENIRQYS